MAFSWTRELTEHFINAFQSHPSLWDIRDALYIDRTRKESSINKIHSAMLKHCPEITNKQIRLKINSIRSQYRKELRALEASKRSGAGLNQIKKPSLWCFEQLDFLRPHTEIRCSQSNVKNINPQHSNIDEQNTPTYTQPSTSKAAKKKQISEEINKGIKNLELILNRSNSKQSYKWFGDQVVQTLHYLNDDALCDEMLGKMQLIMLEFKAKKRSLLSQAAIGAIASHDPPSESIISLDSPDETIVSLDSPDETIVSVDAPDMISRPDLLMQAMEDIFDDIKTAH